MSRISIAVMGLSGEKSHGLAGNYQLRNYIDEEHPRQNKLSEKFSITIPCAPVHEQQGPGEVLDAGVEAVKIYSCQFRDGIVG